MEEEITEYKTSEDTKIKVACASCSSVWDERGADDLNTVALNLGLAKKSFTTRGIWRSSRLKRTIRGDDYAKLTAEAMDDYCDDCWHTFFTDEPAVKIEEPEYYVEEEKRTLYSCDFCGFTMGEDVDHSVFVNPRIVIKRINRGLELTHEETAVLTRDIEDSATGGGMYDKLSPEYDEKYDCCESCATDIFPVNRKTYSESRGLLRRVFGL